LLFFLIFIFKEFFILKVLCPHLLRYLAVAVVTSKNKQKISMKDLIKVIDVVS